jgi:hypothetical protein
MSEKKKVRKVVHFLIRSDVFPGNKLLALSFFFSDNPLGPLDGLRAKPCTCKLNPHRISSLGPLGSNCISL